MDYSVLIGLGISFLQMFLGGLKSKLPTEIAAAVGAALAALEAHKADTITMAALDAQRN